MRKTYEKIELGLSLSPQATTLTARTCIIRPGKVWLSKTMWPWADTKLEARPTISKPKQHWPFLAGNFCTPDLSTKNVESTSKNSDVGVGLITPSSLENKDPGLVQMIPETLENLEPQFCTQESADATNGADFII